MFLNHGGRNSVRYLPSICLSAFVMSPLWRANFHPVDDHEFTAMLSLDGGSTAGRLWLRIFEMSPAVNYPNSIHWRPAVWVARGVESTVFGDQVWAYFVWRTFLLTTLAMLGVSIVTKIIDCAHRTRDDATAATFWIPVLSGLLLVSIPGLHDVFGRLLPGEMYTLIGLLAWLLSWLQLYRIRVDEGTVGPFIAVSTSIGLILLATGKEDAAFLWPAAILASGPEIIFWCRKRPLILGAGLIFSGVLWILSITQLINTLVLQGNNLPYHPISTSGSGITWSVLARMDKMLVILILGSVILLIFMRRRLEGVLLRLYCLLLTLATLELIYVSTVPVAAPRYTGVITAALILILVLTFINLRSELTSRPVYFIFVKICVILAFSLGGLHQYKQNHLYSEISRTWNVEIGTIFEAARDSEIRQIRLVVDPPTENSIGRWEKSVSFAKFGRLESSGGLTFFLELMDSDSPNIQLDAANELRRYSKFGLRDRAGVIFSPHSEYEDGKVLCVLYSDSGREFRLSSECSDTVRLSL